MTKQTTRAGIVAGIALLTVATFNVGASAATDPEDAATRAFELRLAGQVDEAVQMLETNIAAYPQSGVLHYELARTRLFLLDIPGMREEAEAAVRCAPEDNRFRYFAAMSSLYSVIDAAHHKDVGLMRAMGGKAIDQLETILQTDPDHNQARYLLVQQSVEMAPEIGLKVEGTEEHVAILEAKDAILGAKARCCLVGEDEQRTIWKKILADHPEDSRALVEAAEGLITAGDLTLASECLENAIQKDKAHGYGLLRLGLAYAMQEKWDQAIETTERYIQLEPPIALKAFATSRLAMIHRRLGDQDRSRQLMEKARRMDSHVWRTVGAPPKEIFTPL